MTFHLDLDGEKSHEPPRGTSFHAPPLYPVVYDVCRAMRAPLAKITVSLLSRHGRGVPRTRFNEVVSRTNSFGARPFRRVLSRRNPGGKCPSFQGRVPKTR